MTVAIVIIALIVAALSKPDPVQQRLNCRNRQISNPNIVFTPPPGP